MARRLGMKCSDCGHWNRVLVDKIFVEPDTPEPKVKVLIPMYKPLQVSKCEKCEKVIAEPKRTDTRCFYAGCARAYSREKNKLRQMRQSLNKLCTRCFSTPL
jgi:hypothetical protein